MSTNVRKALERFSSLPPAEQESIAESLLQEIDRVESQRETTRKPFKVEPFNLGRLSELSHDELDAIAWGDAEALGYPSQP